MIKLSDVVCIFCFDWFIVGVKATDSADLLSDDF